MKALLTTALLGPILFVQGRSVRLNTPTLPEPDGQRTGSCGSGPLLRLLVIGDSSAAGVGADHQSQALLGQLLSHLGKAYQVHYHLLAKTGATTADALGWLDNIESQPFDVVVTALGVNDVTGMRSKHRFMREQRQLLTVLQQRFALPQIVVSGLPPMQHFPALPQPLRGFLGSRAAAFDAAGSLVAAEHNTLHLPFDFPFELSAMATDGFHPGPGAYAIWGEATALAIAQLLAQAGRDIQLES